MLTAKDLLYKALDYEGFWSSSKKMKASKPSALRLVQLEKLLHAFGIRKENATAQTQVPYNLPEGRIMVTSYVVSGRAAALNRPDHIKTLTPFQYFKSGEFIADANRAKYQALIAEIIVTATTIFPGQATTIDKQPLNLVRLFSQLFNFRFGVYHMFQSGFGKSSASEFLLEDQYSLHLQENFSKAINNNMAEIDGLLCTLIDPENKSFTEEELAFPQYDFAALDKEWHEEFRKERAARG